MRDSSEFKIVTEEGRKMRFLCSPENTSRRSEWFRVHRVRHLAVLKKTNYLDKVLRFLRQALKPFTTPGKLKK